MGLQRQLLPIIMLWFCYSSCYSNLLEDPLSAFNHEALPYEKGAYPTYFGTIDEVDHEFGNQISTTTQFGRSIFSSLRFDQVGSPESSATVVNVKDFGAKGDGTDDTKAFEKAWQKACSSSAPSVLVVPAKKNYLLKPITFSGPCRSSITVMILGTIEAPSDPSDWDQLDRTRWLLFQKVQNLRVQGGGTINGNGEMWWKNSCKINKALPCKNAPTALTFYSCKNLILNDLKIKDSQQIQVSFESCVNVLASNLMVTAPETSPNTDGIHITNTQNIQIMNSVIRTGDDCISIESGSQNVKAMNITCGPGHGISIGSLGDDKSEAHVSQVIVDGATLFGTTNGVRIKTWQGGSGSATNIKFQNIAMYNVTRPIIIDQNYCDSKYPCPEKGSAVEVSDVIYKNIRGTSTSDEAVTFDCSQSSPCNGIVLQDINLVGYAGQKTSSSCKNVRGSTIGKVVPTSCF
ncbi:polygalacturonase-like [Magnolia sinica]|uniref:polygalacturonase-like n=1 Tax=Magnolia sinica TaxID=86752 RepID=UPI002659B733|nr:polygalacturonase-like [Magnolia sinica]